MRSRTLNRRNDRRALLLTLAGAGASLAIMLLVLGEPALRACAPDDRGTFACLRDATFKRLNLPAEQVAELPQTGPVETTAPPAPESEPPALAEAPDPRMPEVHFEVVVTPEPLVTAAVEPEAPSEPYRPAPDKLERAPVLTPPQNVPTPDIAVVPSAPLPAETGSIETPVAPAVEALVEPERLELPQLPPPPLAPERAETPVVTPAPVAPATTAPEPSRLADQPLPSSALPVPQVAAPATPPVVAPADSAAAAATAIADPAPALPPELAASPAPVEPPAPVAEVSPIPSEPPPNITATPPADPTIDTIAFDLTGTVVAGDGPEGAVIELYVDAELVGEGEVLDGRWEVFGAPLFAAPLQTLRAIAIDAKSGRVLGETEITIELELPESAAPTAPEEIATENPDRIAAAPAVPSTPEANEPLEAPDANLTADLSSDDTSPTVPEVAAPAEIGPKVLPPLRTVVPRGETSSVTILPDARPRLREHPEGGFAILGD